MGYEVNTDGFGFDKSVLNLEPGVNQNGKNKTPHPEGRVYAVNVPVKKVPPATLTV
jgi:hypothetical protein